MITLITASINDTTCDNWTIIATRQLVTVWSKGAKEISFAPLNLLSDEASSYNRLLYSLKSNPTITQGGHEMFITDYFAG